MCTARVQGHYACCCADTWASELGILSRSRPRLITTGRPVPPGTNGGVTAQGLACSAAGGAFVGAAFGAAGALGCASGAPLRGGSLCPAGHPVMGAGSWLTGPAGVATLTAVGVACGLFGSLLDSVLGATLQYTGWMHGRRAWWAGGTVTVPIARPSIARTRTPAGKRLCHIMAERMAGERRTRRRWCTLAGCRC